MVKDLKALLKKGKLTGEEVGRLVLKDFIYGNKKALQMIAQTEDKDGFLVNNRDLSMFTQAERDRLTDSFPSTNHDIRAYHSYRSLVDYLVKLYSIFMSHEDKLDGVIFRFYSLVSTEFKGEELTELYHLDNRHSLPQIMTEKQYQRELETQKKEKLQERRQIDEVIIETISEYARLHDKGEATPYQDLFNRYDKEPITKQNQLEEYTLEEGDEPPSRLDILLDIESFYVNHRDSEPIEEFIKDYPNLFEAVSEELSKVTGLKTIKRLKPDTMRKREISVKTLYEAGIPAYVDFIETYYPENHNKVAIVKDDDSEEYKSFTLLEPKRFFLYGEEDINAVDITNHIQMIKDDLKHLFAISSTFAIIAERTDEPELTELTKVNISFLNNLIEAVHAFNELYPDSRFIRIIKEAQLDPGKLIDIDSLKPKPENIKRAKKLIEGDLSYFLNDNMLEYVVKGAI